MIDVDNELRLACKTGKVILGSRRTVEEVKWGRAKLVIVASNCPKPVRDDIQYYAKLSGIPVYVHRKTSIDLGRVCGKPFQVAAIAIRDPGDSRILEVGGGGSE